MTSTGSADAGAAKTFEETPAAKIARLERLLADERKFSVRATRQLHRGLARELREAQERADEAERRAAEWERKAVTAQRHARRARRELDELHGTTTWRAGRALVAVPARVKRRLESRSPRSSQ